MPVSVTIACAFDERGLAAFERESTPGSVDVLILPELFDGGYRRLHSEKGASDQIKQTAAWFEQISRNHRLHLVAGTVAWLWDDGKLRNTSLVFSAGRRIATVAKTHLFRPLGDDQYFASGSRGDVVTLEVNGRAVQTGVIVCYDLRFPELVRPWFKKGIDLLVVPARWPRVRDEIWQLLLRARAVENQCFVVGIDSRDDEGGGSYAFGPSGDTHFALGPDVTSNEAPWQSFKIDLDEIANVKERLDTRRDAILL